MGYYMSELYRRYFRATGFSELEEEIENTRQEVRDCLDQAQRQMLMHLPPTPWSMAWTSRHCPPSSAMCPAPQP